MVIELNMVAVGFIGSGKLKIHVARLNGSVTVVHEGPFLVLHGESQKLIDGMPEQAPEVGSVCFGHSLEFGTSRQCVQCQEMDFPNLPFEPAPSASMDASSFSGLVR